MKHEQQMVRDWMVRFGQETPSGKPVIPSLDIRKLRAKLIMEETLETIAGLGIRCSIKKSASSVGLDAEYIFEEHPSFEPSLVEIADGIADSLVVLLGTAVACGIDIKPVFDEVMRSNDSKLWYHKDMYEKYGTYFMPSTMEIGDSYFPETDRKATLVMYNNDGISVWLVKDRDGKVIKSPSYSPASIEGILQT